MVESQEPGHEGAFSTERSGGLPLLKVVQLCFSGKYTLQTLWQALNREGGLYSYLGTRDLREVERRIEAGDARAALIFDAMAYQIAKDIGTMATALCGRVDAILLTGGMAHSKKLVDAIRPYVEWIAPIVVYPGEDELQAMAEGALRVLRHEEQAQELANSYGGGVPIAGHRALRRAMISELRRLGKRTPRRDSFCNSLYSALAPPSTVKSAAVIQLDSSEAKGRRPCNVFGLTHTLDDRCANTLSRKPGISMTGEVAAVTVIPGEMVLARMLCGPPSRANWRVMAMMPPFPAQCARAGDPSSTR